MGEEGASGGGVKAFSKALQGFLITALGLVLAPVAVQVWPRLFHQPAPEGLKGLVGELAGVLVAGMAYVGVEALRRWKSRGDRRTPKARGDRLTIFVAKIADDKESDEARDAVIDAIREELPRSVLEMLPAGEQFELTKGVSEDIRTKHAEEAGRALLRKNQGDLLIWGRIRRLLGEAKIELYLVAAHAGDEVRGGNKMTLDANFGKEMGAVLAGMVSASAVRSVSNSGAFLVESLKPLAAKLRLLTEGLPPGLNKEDRGKVYFSSGLLEAALGAQTGEAWRLEAAEAAYRQALLEQPMEAAPLVWANTQTALGVVLWSAGLREQGTAKLDESVEAYRAALAVQGRENAALDSAGTMVNLGNSLLSLGERATDTAKLEEAVTVFEASLKVSPDGITRRDRANTENSIGNAVACIGERLKSKERLEAAIAMYRDALTVRTEKDLPLEYAATQTNICDTLRVLGELGEGPQMLLEAVRVGRDAVRVFGRVPRSMDAAMAQNNLGTALLRYSQMGGGTGVLREAIVALKAALGVFRGAAPFQEATTAKLLEEAEGLLTGRAE